MSLCYSFVCFLLRLSALLHSSKLLNLSARPLASSSRSQVSISIACAPGSRFDPPSKRCVACIPGSYSSQYSLNMTCTSCPPQTHAPQGTHMLPFHPSLLLSRSCHLLVMHIHWYSRAYAVPCLMPVSIVNVLLFSRIPQFKC